ncbi:MAG: class I SAM-dependent methyltransferase [Bacteroidales bacterium]|nr:class I SAM-dependent methyltransferase [Bacteroidales bacterium]
MDKEYWEQYYNQHRLPGKPSPFAEEIINHLLPHDSLLELGCGNGRDAIFFADHKIQVTGIDQAINEIDFLNRNYANDNLRFICDDFTKITKLNGLFDSIYSRFTFHAISLQQENHVLQWIKENLKSGGLFFLEVRSVKDKLFNEGVAVVDEENAKITTHYRRFSDFAIIKQKIVDLGFSIVFSIEDKNLARYKDENPIIIRIIAKAN